LRVLQLVSRDDVGGVRVLTEMIGQGLERSGVTVETMALIGGTGLGRIGHVVRALARIATGRYDAILAYHAAASVVAGSVGAVAGVPLRVSHLTAIPSAIRPHWRVLDRVIGSLGGYTSIIANSTTTEAAFADYPQGFTSRVQLIPHGVAPLPSSTEADWRRRLGVRPEHTFLVASGRLTPQKDFATAVRALPLLPETALAIAGDGEQHGMLLDLAGTLDVADRLHLVGNLDHSTLGGFLAAGDCYLMPSVWETFGLAGVEAQMLGLPIVASDLPVLHEVLLQTGTVRFHHPGDAESLAGAVQEFVSSAPEPSLRAATARAAIAQHGVDRMIRSYLDLLTPAAQPVPQH
jgi:glycosyltransferase involved in cell wall biosynthesis